MCRRDSLRIICRSKTDRLLQKEASGGKQPSEQRLIRFSGHHLLAAYSESAAPPLGLDFMGFNVRCCISWDEIITQWAARILRDYFFRVLASIVLQRMALS